MSPNQTANAPSEARLTANRENAGKSTGPTTLEGKAKSSLNAVKTGLTARTVLLSTDDAAAYQSHLARFTTQYSPATDEEKALVQSIADADWRLLRITPLEAGVYAIGRRELAAEFSDEPDPATREALLQAKIFMTYRKDLNNLALQERRIRNHRAADIAQLENLQTTRHTRQGTNLRQASSLYQLSLQRKISFDPAFFGFDFSLPQLAEHHARQLAESFVLNGGSPSDKDKYENFFAEWTARMPYKAPKAA